MNAVERRVSLLQEAICVAERCGFSGAKLTPAISGKKGLVFLGASDRGPFVLRLYLDPLRFIRWRWVFGRLRSAGIDLCPEVLKVSLFRILPFPVWAVVEERLSPPSGLELYQKLDLLERLSLMHSRTSIRWRFLHSLIMRKWIKKTEGSLVFLKERAPQVGVSLSRLWERVNITTEPLLALCHRDVGFSNSGLRGDRLLLLDWDRASFFFPQFEFLQCCYFFDLELEDALDVYLKGSGFGDSFLSGFSVFKAMFLISRAKKLVRRGDLSKLDRICYLVEAWSRRID